MNTLALSILWALVRTGLVLSLSAVAVAACLRLFHVASPTVRRTAYVAVLLQGWLVFEGPFSLPLPSFVSKAVDWPAVADRLSENYGFRVALGPPFADPPVFDRRPMREATGGQAASATQPSADEILREETATNGKESVRSGSIAGSNPSREGAAAGPSTFTADDEWKSIASQKSAGGPKLPRLDRARRGPVAPEQEPIGSVAASVAMPPSHERLFPWSLALPSLWVAGIALIAGRSAWAYVRFVHRFPASREIPPDWADEWTSLQLEAGLRGSVPLVVAEHVGPVLCRLPRSYRLIVPGDAWRTLNQSQRLLILRHELAHIERNDVWKSLAMRILALPQWFNPLVWRIVRRFDESAEWACDEAAAGAAPECVPDYARALLQLSHRAQPAFFATSAARSAGLSLRIRRLLNPAAKKETKMKLALMAVLLLGISLVNITRLQTRAESPPAAVDDKEQISRTPQAAADEPAATKPDSKQLPGLVTVQAPVTKLNVVPFSVTKPNVVPYPVTKLNVVPYPVTKLNTVPFPVTKPNVVPFTVTKINAVRATTASEFVPQQAYVNSSIDAPPAIAAPVVAARGVVASAPVQTGAELGASSAADEKTKTPQAEAAPPGKTERHRLRPGGGARLDLSAQQIRLGIMAVRPNAKSNPAEILVEVRDGEVHVVGPGSATVVNVVDTPHEARVNLPYILEHMRQFQREQEELKASLAEMEKWQETEGDRLAAVNKRLEEEKDPVVRSFLEKGLSQKTAELQREDQGRRDKLSQREMNMHCQNEQRITDEIARYANEHKILVVRRMPFANENGARAVPAPASARVTPSPEAPVLVTPPETRTAPGTAAAPPLPPPAAPPPVMPLRGSAGLLAPAVPASSAKTPAAPPLPSAAGVGAGTSAGIAAFRHAVPLPTAPVFSFFVNPPEVLYVAKAHGELIPDISDEIVKRLNAADEVKDKASNAPSK